MHRDGARTWRSTLLPAIVFLISMLLAVVSSRLVWLAAHARDSDRFDAAVDQARVTIQSRMETQVALLSGAAALVSNAKDLDRGTFNQYMRQLQVGQTEAGSLGIGYTARIPQLLADDFRAKMNLEGRTGFDYWPRVEGQDIHAILYLYPEEGANEGALGYNMYSDPTRREAMDAARDTGLPAASGRVMLVQEEYLPDKQYGFLIYVPIYWGGSQPRTLDERRRFLQGFVYSPYRATTLFQGMLGTTPQIGIRIWDGPIRSEDHVLFTSAAIRSQAKGYSPAFQSFGPVPSSGKRWQVEFQTTPEFDRLSQKGSAFYVLGVGFLISLLAFLLTYGEVKAREKLQLEISERVATERELRLSQQRISTLVEQAPLSIQVLDPAGGTLAVNRGFEELWGLSLKELQGYNVLDDPQVAEKGVLPYLQRAFGGEAVKIPAILYEGTKTLGVGNSRWVSALAYPLKDEEGRVSEVVLIHQDLSELKKYEDELLKVNANLEQRVEQRTEELALAIAEMEAFSYSVAHDLRSPLRAMGGFARILKEDYTSKLDPEAQKLLDRIQDNANRMGLLIDGLLDLSRVSRASIEKEEVDLTQAAEEVVGNLQKRVPRDHVEVSIQPGLNAYADPRLVTNVLQNLLENAWKFTQNNEQTYIEVGKAESTRTEDVFFVKDNGAGFEQEYAHKLFGAFERLHNNVDFPGTGIGLATVRRIVERHGGRVWAEGEVGKGATFYFSIPDGHGVGKPKASKASASAGRRVSTESR